MAVVVTLLLSLICLWPLTQAWFHRDDFWLLTLARYTANPVDFWTYDHSAFYFFRPFAMTLWWLSVALLGIDPLSHYVLNTLLHFLVAVSFGWWIRLLTSSKAVAVVAMLLYAVHPIAVRTTLWLSDRFDLLATASVFAACALFLSPSTTAWRRPALCAMAWCAVFSKESGFALPILILIHFAFRCRNSAAATNGINRRRMKFDLLWVGALAAVAVFWRWLLLSSRGVPILDEAVSQTIAEGAHAYLRAFSTSIFGIFNLAPAGTGIILVLVVVVLIIWGVRVFSLRAALAGREAYCLGTALMLFCLAIHAPIAAQNLGADAVAEYVPAVRIFHLALAAPFIMIAVPLTRFVANASRTTHMTVALGVSVLLAIATVQSHHFAQAWASSTNGPTKQTITAAVSAIARADLPYACRIMVTGLTTDASEFREASDVMVKAISQAPAERLLGCVVLTDRAPHFSLVARNLCAREPWRPLQPIHPLVQPHPFGTLCYQFFAMPDDAALKLDKNAVWINLAQPVDPL